MMLTHLQTMCIVSRLRLAWPRSFRSVMAVALFFNGQLDLSSARPECVLYWNNYPSYHVWNLGLISILPVCIAVCYVIRLFRTSPNSCRRTPIVSGQVSAESCNLICSCTPRLAVSDPSLTDMRMVAGLFGRGA